MPETEFSTIAYTVRDDVAYLNLDNPPVNIMTAAMMDEITAALETAAADKSLKAVAFTAGGKAFCAGADVGEHKPEQAPAMIAAFGRLFRRLDAMEVPVVMAVGGAAMGAGFELILMADVLLAAEGAMFGQPEIRLGFFAPVGVVELPALVGRAKAMEITTTGRNYDAAEMADLGLVSRVVPADDLDDALEGVLKDLRRAAGAAPQHAHAQAFARGRLRRLARRGRARLPRGPDDQCGSRGGHRGVLREAQARVEERLAGFMTDDRS